MLTTKEFIRVLEFRQSLGLEGPIERDLDGKIIPPEQVAAYYRRQNESFKKSQSNYHNPRKYLKK